MNRAMAFHQELAQKVANGDDVPTHLDSVIKRARIALEECLHGYDSFDTLAFLRMAMSPWDFSQVRESESLLEYSQAAQDVVALTLLGMGLPRKALTEDNSGQPDTSKAMSSAADILEAARARAVFRGQQAPQPLGALAGEFVGHELSVRGRQFGSIASELNTKLFADPPVETIVKDVLGFTLHEVRAVREASTALLNERFFGARDRLGEAAELRANGDPDQFRKDWNLMLNECRLFGAVSIHDVALRGSISEGTARSVLDFFSISRPANDDENPVLKFVQGEPQIRSGCIADEGEYLILNGFLGEDELRRDIERGLIAAKSGKQWSKYDKRRAAYSESLASSALSGLLNGAKPFWRGQKYIGPVDINDTVHLGRNASRGEVPSREFESDLLFVVDGIALCVEVKAGSITDKSRGGNPTRLATDLQKTLKEGNEQADRLTRLVASNKGVWDSKGTWIDLSAVHEVHSAVVMLDDMGPLSLSMNELALKGVIQTEEFPWIVSMHDLIVISRTIDHPAQFLEYLRRRRGRKLATMVKGVDELDMFMWFITGGMYFEPDPREVAAQLPISTPVTASELRRYDGQPQVRLGTLTDALDAWFYSNEDLSQADAPKPVRKEQPWVEQFLTKSESIQSPGWLRFGADLVGLSEEAQRNLGKNLSDIRRKARGGDTERSMTTHGTTPYGSWLLTAAVVPSKASSDHLPDYMDAKQYQTQSNRSMLLLYRPDGSLSGSRYRGEPEERTTDRDNAMAEAPLLTLTATFRKLPPSARRNTKRLRGNGGNTKRRRR